MISKPKTIPLLNLYLLLSHHVVTPIKMAASSDAPHPSNNSLKNISQVSNVTAPDLSMDFSTNLRQVSSATVPPPLRIDSHENLQTGLQVVALPRMKIFPKTRGQDSHGIEDRLLEIGELQSLAHKLASTLDAEDFPPTGIYKFLSRF